MNRHITNRTFLCEACGRPIDPMRDEWTTNEDGCNICARCMYEEIDAAAEECATELTLIEADINWMPETDLELWRLHHAENQT